MFKVNNISLECKSKFFLYKIIIYSFLGYQINVGQIEGIWFQVFLQTFNLEDMFAYIKKVCLESIKLFLQPMKDKGTFSSKYTSCPLHHQHKLIPALFPLFKIINQDLFQDHHQKPCQVHFNHIYCILVGMLALIKKNRSNKEPNDDYSRDWHIWRICVVKNNKLHKS